MLVRGIVGCFLLCVACSDKQAMPPKMADIKGIAPVATHAAEQTNLEADLLAEHKEKAVSMLTLDTVNFRINGLRAGLQDFMQHNNPVLIYTLPENADYVQIIRCKENTVLKGTFDELSDIDLGSANTHEEVELFIHNDFWTAALVQSNQCVQISEGYSGQAFLDSSAVSGSYRYLMRACVENKRLVDTDFGVKQNCSRLIALSPLLQDYQNDLVAIEQQAQDNVQKLKDRVDGVGRALYLLSVDFNNAMLICQNDETNRQIRVKRKESLIKIMSIGMTLGMQIAMPDAGLSAVMSGAKTWTDIWQETWAIRDDIAGQADPLATALSWLFTSSNDYPRSCTAAKAVASTAQTKTFELKAVHKELATALDYAKQLQSNKQQAELPK